VREYLPDLQSYLVGRCRFSDSKSIEKAREIAADVVSDFFRCEERPRGEDILLKLYHGRAPLKDWLRHVAYSRLKSWWLSLDGKTVRFSQEEQPGGAKTAPVPRDPEIAEILHMALENAFEQIEPHKLLFLRLVYLYSVKRDHLAKIYRCHPAKIGRDMAAAGERIKGLTLRNIKLLDPFAELQWSDLQAICDEFPTLLYGSGVEVE
jgi:DNA-directed RNA polymerase specialized sigma24 family protein